MESVWSWFTSQSGVSLLVALIALIGVLITTWWNNCAADKRRIADQKAADKRRKDDQAAEDARRKADDDRRERERRDQLKREDWARQRRAVADCIREVTKASALVNERAAAALKEGGVEQAKLTRAFELSGFIVEATNQFTLLDIEVTQPHVSAQLEVLWKQVLSDYRPLREARERSDQEWLSIAEDMQPLSNLALHGIRALTLIARLALLEFPEHMATQPVKLIDLNEYYSDTQKKDNDN